MGYDIYIYHCVLTFVLFCFGFGVGSSGFRLGPCIQKQALNLASICQQHQFVQHLIGQFPQLILFFPHKSPTNQLSLPSLLYPLGSDDLPTSFAYITFSFTTSFSDLTAVLNILSFVFSQPYHLHVEIVCVFLNC